MLAPLAAAAAGGKGAASAAGHSEEDAATEAFKAAAVLVADTFLRVRLGVGQGARRGCCN